MTPIRDFTILIADDDPDIRELLVQALSEDGYPVVAAANGAEAVAHARLRRPRLLLLDARMPLLDARDVTDALAALAIEVPVILMTASPFALAWARDTNAVEYLPKPFDLDELSDLVERVRAGEIGAPPPAETAHDR